MSFSRATTPIATSILPILRANAPRAPRHVCRQCLHSARRSLQPAQPSQRRSNATVAQHRPQTFDPQPPPRNTGVPDTSVADDKSSWKPSAISPESTPRSATQNPEQSESQAQQPQSTPNSRGAIGSVASPDPSPSSNTEKPKRRSKLRPRKAAMTLTPQAVEQLQELLNQPDPKLIRVGVKNRGCSGLAYHLEYVDKPGQFDEAVEQDGVKVLVDSKALFSIIGSEMDWIEDKLSRRFVFKNPNITEQCGCGESFSIG